MAGATGNIYTGLMEFAEMGFLLHLLRPGDLFGDIGANIGSYTILASGVTGSNSISVEPVRSTFLNLKRNVAVNDLEALVELCNCGVGAEKGKLYITKDFDTVNHIVSGDEMAGKGTDEVDIVTMDELFSRKTPILIKMDVEGFEMSVLQGGKQILERKELKGIIIELNGACLRYGVKEEDIHQLLLSYNFFPVSYNPIDRDIHALSTFGKNGNTIYIRDESFIRDRITKARKVKVLNHSI